MDGHAQDAAKQESTSGEGRQPADNAAGDSSLGDVLTAIRLIASDVDGATRRRHVQRLQHDVGNRAVSSLIAGQASWLVDPNRVQRQVPPASPPPLASAVRITNKGGHPTIGGSVTATPSATGNVRITGPDTNLLPTDLEIPAGVTLGAGKVILAGVMQTLMGSTRVAHYRSAGSQPSDPTIDKKQELDQSRDAASDLDPTTGQLIPRATAPFYLPPITLSDTNVAGTISVAEGKKADLLDRPGWPARAALGPDEFAPQLVGTSGSDDFITSIVIKYGDNPGLHHLTQDKWSVPWAMTIDPLGIGQGGAGLVEASKIPPPETPGDIAAIKAKLGKGKDWIEFPTLGDAMMCSPGVLLGNLVPAKANDPQSFAFTVQALVAKNPVFDLSFTVNDKLRGVGAERGNLVISGFGTAPARNWEMAEGDVQSVRFHLLEILDEASITAGRPIRFQVTVEPVFGAPIFTSRSMAFPYMPIDESIAIENGNYHLAVKLRG